MWEAAKLLRAETEKPIISSLKMAPSEMNLSIIAERSREEEGGRPQGKAEGGRKKGYREEEKKDLSTSGSRTARPSPETRDRSV